MEKYTTLWNRDTFTKVKVILIWLLLLVSFNLFMFIIWKRPDLLFYMLLLMILSWYSTYKSIRNLNNLKYGFDLSWVTIILPSWKKYLLKKTDIVSIDSIKKIKRWSWLFVKYNYFNNEVRFITSISNLLKINLEDGRSILISPAIVKKEFILYYTN
jgi:hypothetical protein